MYCKRRYGEDIKLTKNKFFNIPTTTFCACFSAHETGYYAVLSTHCHSELHMQQLILLCNIAHANQRIAANETLGRQLGLNPRSWCSSRFITSIARDLFNKHKRLTVHMLNAEQSLWLENIMSWLTNPLIVNCAPLARIASQRHVHSKKHFALTSETRETFNSLFCRKLSRQIFRLLACCVTSPYHTH